MDTGATYTSVPRDQLERLGLLGVVTLEEFRLAVDPVNRRLMPVPALLKELAA